MHLRTLTYAKLVPLILFLSSNYVISSCHSQCQRIYSGFTFSSFIHFDEGKDKFTSGNILLGIYHSGSFYYFE